MKNRKQKQASPVARSRRFSVTMVTAAAILVAVAAITVVSKQLVSSKASALPVAKAAPTENGKKYVTVKVAGREVQVDPQTGQIKPLSPEEALTCFPATVLMVPVPATGPPRVAETAAQAGVGWRSIGRSPRAISLKNNGGGHRRGRPCLVGRAMTGTDPAAALFFRAVARDRHPTPACPASRTLRAYESASVVVRGRSPS